MEHFFVVFGFNENRNLYSHDGVCVNVCVWVCMCVMPSLYNQCISRTVTVTVMIRGMWVALIE